MDNIRDRVINDINEFLRKIKIEYNIEEVKYFFKRLDEAGEECLEDGEDMVYRSNIILACTRERNDFNLISDSELKKKGLIWDDEIKEIK